MGISNEHLIFQIIWILGYSAFVNKGYIICILVGRTAYIQVFISVRTIYSKIGGGKSV